MQTIWVADFRVSEGQRGLGFLYRAEFGAEMGFSPSDLTGHWQLACLRQERLLRRTFDPVRFDGQESGTLQSKCYRAWDESAPCVRNGYAGQIFRLCGRSTK